jgi:hypothetical protein
MLIFGEGRQAPTLETGQMSSLVGVELPGMLFVGTCGHARGGEGRGHAVALHADVEKRRGEKGA